MKGRSDVTTDELIKALTRMKSETGSLADSLCCLGCGREHNCGVHGCAVIGKAIECLNERRWISVKERLSEPYEPVIIAREDGFVGCGNRSISDWLKLYHVLYRDAQTKSVTYWMPIPSGPDEGSEGYYEN